MTLENGERIIDSVERIVKGEGGRDEKLTSVCRILDEMVPHYDWVGFYLTDPVEERMLVLGPYVGEPTEHERIPFGSGICGQAADTGKVFLIQDVSKEENYLSCSPEVRSEIVLPVIRNGEMIGELDIDSHSISPFSEDDRIILERVCEMVAGII